jgi:cyclophilin family peptidyl-prolyl cis-trans isomerase
MRYIAVVLVLTLALGFTGCGQQPQKPKIETPGLMSKPATPLAETLKAQPTDTAGKPPAKPEFTQAPPLMKFSGTPYVTIKVKDIGTIRIKLDPSSAPQNVSNVYQLAKAGFYDGIIFHRIIKDFMVQTGDPTGTGRGGPRYTVPAELKLKNARGAIAMARMGDQVNPSRASSSCQFYIILKDQPSLDQAGYTVIGKVVEGMDVVDQIGAVPVQANEMGEKSSPVTPVVMEKVTVEEK